MTRKHEPPRERHALDDAIDRVVRDMTRVDSGDDAVARVMARVRGEGETREARRSGGAWPWLLSPRAAWSLAGAAALVMAVLITGYWMREPVHDVATTAPATQASNVPAARPPIASDETPRAAVTPPRTALATSHRPPTRVAAVPESSAGPEDAVGSLVQAMSIVAATADTTSAETGDEFQSDLSPRPGDLAAVGIAPAPLPESPALTIEPLVVDAIEPSPITVPPPVGPQR